MIVPSKYQLAIYDWVLNGEGNAVIQATAGSSKSYSALQSMKLMTGDVLSLAFNAKIAYYLKDKIAGMFMPNCKAMTFHAEGKSNLLKAKGWHKVEGSKVYYIVQKHCQTEELSFAAPFIQKIVGFAKNYAIGVKNGGKDINDRQAWLDIIKTQDCSLDADVSIDTCIDVAIEVLKESNRDFKVIDFDDMIYLPLVYDFEFVKYDWIIVDEAQDTNVCRKLMLKKMLKPTGRTLIIGDKNQAIYGFCGAENDSMNLLKDMFNCVELPLNVCYRCAKNIVKEAQAFQPEIEAWEESGDGIVRSESYDDFLKNVSAYSLNRNDGIICRNNAPLVSLAFGLIRQGIGCRIEGKDFAKNLLNLCNKWKVKDLNTFTERMVKFFDKEFEKATKTKMQALEDKLETFIILIERCQSLGKHDVQSLKNLIESMFSDSDDKGLPNVVVLSSIHKAKGLEWDRCFILGMSQFQPSKYAVQEWQIEQERNISYVGLTRAKFELCHITDCPSRNNKPTE